MISKLIFKNVQVGSNFISFRTEKNWFCWNFAENNMYMYKLNSSMNSEFSVGLCEWHKCTYDKNGIRTSYIDIHGVRLI